MEEPEVYISTQQAAAMLGVTARAVLDWATAGKFAGAFRTPGGDRRGGDWRIPRSSIEAFMAGGTPPAEPTERGDT
jgi:excisionase family DNA binding protein